MMASACSKASQSDQSIVDNSSSAAYWSSTFNPLTILLIPSTKSVPAYSPAGPRLIFVNAFSKF
jgi:hypothetical protein